MFTARQENANSRTGQHDADESFSGGASPVGFGVWCLECRQQVWGLEGGISLKFGVGVWIQDSFFRVWEKVLCVESRV